MKPILMVTFSVLSREVPGLVMHFDKHFSESSYKKQRRIKISHSSVDRLVSHLSYRNESLSIDHGDLLLDLSHKGISLRRGKISDIDIGQRVHLLSH